HREDLAHVLRECLAKGGGVGKYWTPVVPLNDQAFPERFSPVRYPEDDKLIAIRPQERGNNRHTVSRLGEGKQGVGSAAFEQDFGFYVRQTASRIELHAHRVTWLQQQQRIGCKAADIDRFGCANVEGRSARGQYLVRLQW